MFAENGCRVITGSDHGKAYVFRTEGGKPIDILQHGTVGDMVQSITVRFLICVTLTNMSNVEADIRR